MGGAGKRKRADVPSSSENRKNRIRVDYEVGSAELTNEIRELSESTMRCDVCVSHLM
jgi:hypothetical protein